MLTILVLLLQQTSSGAEPHDIATRLQSLSRDSRWTQVAELASKQTSVAAIRGDWRQAGRMQYYLCRALFSRRQFDAALRAALAGRDYSQRAQDNVGIALNSFGVGMVHLAIGSYDLGFAGGQQMVDAARRAAMDTTRFEVLHAALAEGSGRNTEALHLLRQAYASAEQRGNWTVVVDVLVRIGMHLLMRNAPAQAESYLLEAFRVSKLLYPKSLGIAYKGIASLRLAQNEPAAALRLAKLSLDIPSDQVQRSSLHELLAHCHLRLGKTEDALVQLRMAIALLRANANDLPSADDLQISYENSVQHIYKRFALTAAARYRTRPAESLATESFEAIQQNRAASLRRRAGTDESWRRRLPDEYWRTLAQLRQSTSREDTHLRASLVEMEASAGVPTALRSNLPSLHKLQSQLKAGEVVICFLVAEPHSLRWVVDRRSVRLTVIPGERILTASAKEFRKLVERDDPAHVTSGTKLAEMLFSGVPTTGLWTLLADDVLFTVPFAALRIGNKYLAERVPLRLAPSAAFIQPPRAARQNLFVGIGDPVFNRADPRAAGERERYTSVGIELPRLTGSAEEIRRAGRLWQHQILLLNQQDGVAPLTAALAQQPRVLHFATHLYFPPGSSSPVIAFGYSRSGKWNVLTDRDVINLGANAPELVTLSGCHSGSGAVAPGSGLLGLTRAWLMAGAAAVMATLWQVPDNSGAFMEDYYGAVLTLRTQGVSRKSAVALQHAQIRAMRRTPPSVWSSFFVIGAI